MAEEKKPKIDLKARLGKTQTSATGAVPVPAPSGVPAPGSIPAPAMPTPVASAPVSIPAPMLPSGGAAAETLGGLARGVATGPFRAQPAAAAPVAPPQPQRIEIDESVVQQARKDATKKAAIGGVVLAFLFGVVGFAAGGAQAAGKSRAQGVADAQALSADVGKAKVTLEQLLAKTTAARDTLTKERKFPENLASELGGLNVDFTGNKLAGVRFSGWKLETTSQLVGFITSVQDINDKKDVLARLLTRLQKPLTEQFANAGKTNVSHVVILGTKDDAGNGLAILAPLSEPIAITPPKFDLPKEFTFIDPFTKNKAGLEKYTGGAITKPVAAYVVPKSVEASFPSEEAGLASQLAVQLANFVRDLKGDDAAPEGIVADTKAGVIERATKLEDALKKVQ